MEIRERIKAFIQYKGITVKQFEERCGMSNGYIGAMRKGLGRPKLNNVLTVFPDLNREWLLYGEGAMLRTAAVSSAPPVEASEHTAASLPLIPIDAVAGFAPGADTEGVTLADCERYRVPELAHSGAQFLVRVSGDSMYPKYCSGDLLACRKIEATFFQWGKVYVLDTEQGVLVKRLFECKENGGGCVICHSENAQVYPDFLLHKTEIRALAIVLGVIRVE